MLNVVCVLRSGGEYTPEHVVALRDGVAAHLPLPHRFVCLTDFPREDGCIAGVPAAPVAHDWPGWWAKMDLFRPGLFTGRVLYLDLDTVIVGDLSDLACYGGDFGIVSDFYRPERPQSCIMAWEADNALSRAIWRSFSRDPERWMHEHERGGDQAFIAGVIYGHEDRLTNLYPDQIVSYKVHVRDGDGVPDDARIVAFHGKPRPWEVEHDL